MSSIFSIYPFFFFQILPFLPFQTGKQNLIVSLIKPSISLNMGLLFRELHFDLILLCHYCFVDLGLRIHGADNF